MATTLTAKLNGNGGNDHIEGGGGEDELRGGSGKDSVNGGSGRDTIEGGSNSDSVAELVDGGDGYDRLQFRNNNGADGLVTFTVNAPGSGRNRWRTRRWRG